jgi:hypothetical protein
VPRRRQVSSWKDQAPGGIVNVELVKYMLEVRHLQGEGGGLHMAESVWQAHAEVPNKLGPVVIDTLACETMMDVQTIHIRASHEGGRDDHKGVIQSKHHTEHQYSSLNHSLSMYDVK